MAQYHPDVFSSATIEQARGIILTAENGVSTDERWEKETAWLLQNLVFPKGLLLDIGCGIGRLAKHLVFDNSVIGVDISSSMRTMAEFEVRDPAHFTALTPSMLRELIDAGLIAQGAYAIWALQHMQACDLDGMVGMLADALEPGSPLWTVDSPERYVPVLTEDGPTWLDDHVAIDGVLQPWFVCYREVLMPAELGFTETFLKHWIKRRSPP